MTEIQFMTNYPNIFTAISLPGITFTNSFAAIHKKLFNNLHCLRLCKVCLITQRLLERLFWKQRKQKVKSKVKALRTTTHS